MTPLHSGSPEEEGKENVKYKEAAGGLLFGGASGGCVSLYIYTHTHTYVYIYIYIYIYIQIMYIYRSGYGVYVGFILGLDWVYIML